jgi:predicted RND superfamily exporter protein
VAVFATALPPLYALGLAAAAGWPISALGAALFPVLGVVGITSTVHLLNAFGEHRLHAPLSTAAWGAAREVARPVALSLVTTAAAFYSLHATRVPAFEAGGLIVGVGVLFAIPVVLLGVPAALCVVRPSPSRRIAARLDAPLVALARMTRRHFVFWSTAGIVLVVGACLAARRAPVEVNVLQAFQPQTEIARTYRFLEERLTATLPVDIVWSANADADVGAILEDLRELDRAVVALPGVDSALGMQSLVDYGQSIAPLGEAATVTFLRNFLGRITQRFEHQESRSYRVKVRVREGTPPEVLDAIESRADEVKTGDATVTGLYVRAVHTTRTLVGDLFRGTAFMVAFVVVVAGIALRSWRLGLAAVIPNALPPAAVFGGAGLLGLSLDVSAVAVGAVAVGLAIDNTLHVLYGVARGSRSGMDLPEALVGTQRSVGRALVISTIVLVAALACLRASAFLPTARFGTMASVSCLVALFGDLVVLPSVLLLLRRL